MKKYRVNVNGTDYEITLEEVTGAEASKPLLPLLRRHRLLLLPLHLPLPLPEANRSSAQCLEIS